VSGEAGFSLIEILISVVIFSAVILGLAGLSFQIARRSTRAMDQAFVMSTMQSRIDRAASVAYDSLPGMVGCDSTVSGRITITTCMAVTPTSQMMSRIRLIVQTSLPGSEPDTISFARGKARSGVPLR
jgi:prepilin-type N-terminal cleavage/methylation domain-containing protein